MPDSTCPACGKKIAEAQNFCASCGRRREASAPPLGAPPEPVGSRGRALKLGGLIAAAAGFAFVVGWKLSGRSMDSAVKPAAEKKFTPPDPLSPAGLSRMSPVATTAPTPAAAPPAPVTQTSAFNPDADAEQPPVPKELEASRQILYGVVYDLATKKPVPRLNLHFQPKTIWSANAAFSAQTNERGWYQLSIPAGAFSGGGVVNIDSHAGQVVATEPRDNLILIVKERNPSLRSRSPGYRRAVYESAVCTRDLPKFDLKPDVPLAEMDLAAISREWPYSMPPAEILAATEPPTPEPAPNPGCKFYGRIYDLATKAAIRCAKLWTGLNATANIVTDDRGNYSFTIPDQRLVRGALRVESIPGYRPGLMAEQDPPLFNLSEDKRHDIAVRRDAAFDPVSLEYDCPDNLRRLDLVAVPEPWPKNPVRPSLP